MGTMCIRGKTLRPTLKGWKWDIWFSTERVRGEECYHGNN